MNFVDLDPKLEGYHRFTREWLEKCLHFGYYYFALEEEYMKLFSDLKNKEFRCCKYKEFHMFGKQDRIKDIHLVFLAGGTCRTPFMKQEIKKLFPKAELIIDGELEIITATGAAIHALQVLNGEVQPYVDVKSIQEKEPSTSRELMKESDTNNKKEAKIQSETSPSDQVFFDPKKLNTTQRTDCNKEHADGSKKEEEHELLPDS